MPAGCVDCVVSLTVILPDGRATSCETPLELVDLSPPTLAGKADYGHKLLSLMRNAFGGHAMKSTGK